MMMYAVTFAIPTITIIATDVAIYFKVTLPALPPRLAQMKAIQHSDIRMSVTKHDERRMERVN
jgi:hypothetical protein